MARKQVTIGRHNLEAKHIEYDGYLWSIEASGSNKENASSSQKFSPYQLKDITANAFPNETTLFIYQPELALRHIDALYVNKKNQTTKIQLSVILDFAEWDLQESLSNFVDRYVDSVKASGLTTDHSKDKSEYGYSIYFEMSLKNDDDIYKRLIGFVETLESHYRQCLVPSIQATSDQKYGDGKLHWWLRYVVVPLVCSGGIAAVLVKYLLHSGS